jgi:DNA-binding transcriptional regulator YhcF (GntR family)
MLARVVEHVTIHFKKKPFPLGKELEEAVKKVMETGEPQIVDNGWSQYIVKKTERGIRINVRAHVATYEVLTEEYVCEKYKDIVKFMKEKGTVKKKELEKKFYSWRVAEFLEAAKALGMIKSTSRGYKLILNENGKEES